MLKIIKKNLNLIILVILLKIFSSSLNDFIATSDEIKISMDNRLIETEDVINPVESFNDKKRFILVKRSQNSPKIEIKAEKRDVKVAKFRNPESTSDYFEDETKIDYKLVPVYDKILFSGVPIPESKPHPTQKLSTRFEVITVKNKKELKSILNDRIKFIVNYQELLDLILKEINFEARKNLKFFYSNEGFYSETLAEVSIFKNKLYEVNAKLNNYDRFVSQYVAAQTERKILRNKVRVINSIHSSLKGEEIPKEIVKEFINQFSFSVDFQRDISENDLIEILYEANFVGNDEMVGDPKLLYASLDMKKNQKIELFRYKMKNGKIDYFDSEGKSIRKSIMRTPINGARLSSRFGLRKHPILGFSKMHRGVDFAAKRGTPIMSAGDGKVSFAGRNGSYGKFIEIRHLNGFSTRYGHLQKFARNLKKGKNVKQGEIIGYVGNTGRSTGPHLHYEVKHKRRIINPMTLKLPSKVQVDSKEISNFYANISLTRDRLATTPVKFKSKLVNY